MGYFFFIVVGHSRPADPHTLQAIFNKLGSSIQLDPKTLWLHTPNTYVTEHEEIKLVLIWKFHPYRPAFVLLEGAVHTLERKNNYQSYAFVNSVSDSSD